MSITIKDDNDALDHSACQSVTAQYKTNKQTPLALFGEIKIYICIIWGNETSTKELEDGKYVQRTRRQHKTS